MSTSKGKDLNDIIEEYAKKTFTEEVHDITLSSITEINGILMNPNLRITRVSTMLYFPPEFLKKWELNDFIMCEITFYGNNTTDSKFLYGGHEVQPDCYYMRPTPYTDVSLTRTLQECVKQETNKPDIKPIECGEVK